MEPAATSWGPCGFQHQANWIPQEPSAAGLHVEYASIDIPTVTCCGLQAYQLPESSGVLQQHLDEYYNYYYSAAASQHNANSMTGEKAAMISNDCRARCAVKQVVGEFKDHIDMMKYKMHRYPACLRSVDVAYTVPRIVAIGPYHRHLDHLKPAETVKHAAACHCVMHSGRLLEDLYGAVVHVADTVRCLYDKDVMAGISYEDFRHMMFFDACFLVQNMLMRSGTNKMDKSLLGFLRPNRGDIFRDIMLLENQIPWTVVETVMSFMPMASTTIAKNFVRAKRVCMLPDDDVKHDEPPEDEPFEWDDSYKPQHLLSLLRYYIVGRRKIETDYPIATHEYIPASVSVIKLTEIGITLTANRTMELIDMRLNKNLFAELALPPLSLDRDRASYLVNMASLELCTVQSFSRAKARESAFCSYLLLLAMLVSREEDVHELRVRGLLVGGGGLSNKEALEFFKSFQGLRFGQFYNYVMVQIESYREKKRMQIKLYSFLRKNRNTISKAFAVIVSVGGIIGTLLSIKKAV